MDPETKIFVSHASEDKADFVREFSELLRTRCRVWYDEYSLPFGASIFGSISAGLQQCDFGVVVLSLDFFNKKWTQDEIAGLVALETADRKKIIPIWKGVTKEQVALFSPILADRRGIDCSRGAAYAVDCVADAVNAINQSVGYTTVSHTPRIPEHQFAELGARLNQHNTVTAMNRSPDAPSKIRAAQSELFAEIEARVQQVALATPAFNLTWKSGEFHCIPNDIIWLNVTLPNQDIFRLEATRPNRFYEQLRLDLNVFRPKRDDNGQYTYPDHLEDYRFAPHLNAVGGVEWKNDTNETLSATQIGDLALSMLFRHLEPLVDRLISPG